MPSKPLDILTHFKELSLQRYRDLLNETTYKIEELDLAHFKLTTNELSTLLAMSSGLQLSYITHMYVSYNALENDFTDTICQYLIHMHTLEMAYNPAITDTGIAHLKGLPLIYLDISGNTLITSQGLQNIAALTSLQHLIAKGMSHIISYNLEYLNQHPNLKTLKISYEFYQSSNFQSPVYLQPLSSLQSLMVEGFALRTTQLTQLLSVGIQTLNVRGNCLSDISLEQILLTLPNLTDLDISRNTICLSDRVYSPPSTLTRLNLSYNYIGDHYSNLYLFTSLRHLNLSKNRLDYRIWSVTNQFLTSLESLKLKRNNLDSGCELDLHHCKQLKYLDISFNVYNFNNLYKLILPVAHQFEVFAFKDIMPSRDVLFQLSSLLQLNPKLTFKSTLAKHGSLIRQTFHAFNQVNRLNQATSLGLSEQATYREAVNFFRRNDISAPQTIDTAKLQMTYSLKMIAACHLYRDRQHKAWPLLGSLILTDELNDLFFEEKRAEFLAEIQRKQKNNQNSN